MSSPALPDEDLERARHNLQRVCEFLAIHTAPPPTGDGRSEVAALFDAAVTLCQRLQPLLEVNGASPPRPVRTPEPDSARPMDPARAARFADFVAQLDRWFAVQISSAASPRGIEALRAMYASLVTIRTATSGLLDRIDAPAAPPPAETSAAAPADARESAPTAPPARPRSDTKLLLVDVDERPLLASFQGTNELTDTAVADLSGFLAEHGIELSSYQRRKLDDKVRRWIEATPDGQALVLKVGGLRGGLEPYPSYVPREAVKAEIEKLRGYG